MKFDKYTLVARLYPSIIVLLPILLFTINCNIANLGVTFDSLLQVKIISNVTVSIVLLYLFMQLNRFLGKFIFERKMFKDELEMPSTRFLLYTNTEFSRNYKNLIRERIKKDFQIVMPTEQDEDHNHKETKRRITEAVGLIREKVKEGRLLLQHYMEYGFARNLIGGAIIGVIVSCLDVIYFFIINDSIIAWISVIFACFFTGLLLLHKVILNYLANQYAKKLFQEYLE